MDAAIASTGEEELRGLHIKVVLVEGGNGLSLTVKDQVGDDRGVPCFVMVYKPPNPWMETRQGFW